ncbi:hypothetical protein HMPREF2822_12275 [Corynebacterium sp. HMSC062E11]|uniref:hypothetical protein n=1 Tax=Corynebacterium sp. HMSC062E11 TaxID=1739326 RepID=UPI0008A1D8A9|nr:hypothetical protein [Corynebacterium sp. HMSC062E11]OFK27212.1 hypothetical protein HMPREF2822_12275 [Corynebacterium sp. HMSC062E11]
MTNPTRQEIIDANSALASLVCFALSNTSDPDEKDWIKTEGRAIAAVLPPRPRPTMAEVEWDDDVHYLAEAETPDLVGKVVMLRKTESGLIEFTMTTCTPLTKGCTWPEKLTPTGKRYTLTEVQE